MFWSTKPPRSRRGSVFAREATDEQQEELRRRQRATPAESPGSKRGGELAKVHPDKADVDEAPSWDGEPDEGDSRAG